MDPNLTTTADTLRAIALLNPRLALMLARGQPLAPRTYTIDLRWDAATADFTIEQHMAERLYQDCWVSDLVYTLDSPNIAPGSVWQPMIEQSYVQSAGNWLLVRMRVEGPDRFEMTNEFTPIGAIASHNNFEGKLLDKAWVLTHDQNLFVQANNTRTISVPTTLRLTLCVKELSGCNLRNIGYSEAVCALKKMGILPSYEGDQG